MTDMEVEVASPGEVRIRRDLEGAGFRAGLRAGKWRNPVLTWPVLKIEVAVGDDQFALLRLLVDEYPTLAPHGQLWAYGDADRPLTPDHWPRGGSAERVYRTDWSPANQNAPYLPCDRVGLATHPNWAAECPERSWNPSRTIDFYLSEIWGELVDARLYESQVVA